MQLQLLSYIALGVLSVVLTAKFIRYFRMPLHVRWELYPVPHEKGKEYGGSYLENMDWWTKPINHSFIEPIKFLMIEVLLVKSLFHDNRKLWYVSYPFHLGLYTMIASLGLLTLGALADVFGMTPQGTLSVILKNITAALCVFSFSIGSIGCIGLLLRRIFDPNLRLYSAFKDYFNLILILAIFTSGLAALFSVDKSLAVYQSYIKSVITVTNMQITSTPMAVHLILISAFGIYLPFTHMTHFIGKYFMWDKIRWDDKPNFRGSKIEAKVNKQVLEKITWSAPHLYQGKNWLENVTDLDIVDKEVEK